MLVLKGFIDIPSHAPSEFDHGDVHPQTGRVFVAHTAAGTVEVLDGERGVHLMTIPGCPEGSGVLCAQDGETVFAAARGGGKVLVIEALSGRVLRELAVGPRPNGLAWDSAYRTLLVADVADNQARLLDPFAEPAGQTLARWGLVGRPRWCVYDRDRGRFLINVREPACVTVLAAQTGEPIAHWAISAAGPHGLDFDAAAARAYVACDVGMVVSLDLVTGQEQGSVPIAGSPDAIWYNPRRQRLYVAIAEPGVIDVVNTQSMTLEERIPTETNAHTTAFDQQRQRLYVFLPTTCRAAVYVEE